MKRLFDIIVAFVGLVILLPVMILVAILIRINLGSPIMFNQLRPGLLGKPIRIYKFRTMTDEYNEAGELVPTFERITKFGQIIRRLSLDELPQLLNVLKGDMSIVGPRPLLMEYLDRYSPEQARRNEVRPGITGWAQVNGRNAISWDERFKLDVWYVDNQSLLLDFKIIWSTLIKVIRSEDVNQASNVTMPIFMGNNDPDTEQEEFNKIIIIGAGGVGKGIYQIIEDINKVKKTWDIIGFIDENEEKSKGMLFNLPVFGSIDVLNDPFYAGVHVTFAIGNPVEKMKLIEKFRVKYPKVTSPTLIHPTAIVSNEAKIGVGTVVNALVVIEPHSYIGDFVLVYYGCMIGHDSMIEDYVSLLPQSNVSGDVVVKKCASLGSNSTIIQGIEVGEYTVVGAGAVVLKSLPAQCTAVGVPAKAIKFHHEMKVGMLNG